MRSRHFENSSGGWLVGWFACTDLTTENIQGFIVYCTINTLARSPVRTHGIIAKDKKK